ncbi:DMT family transporter [Dendrosporobacter sp. 1207_IL3150]|uniref:DMT family transporter n=1 Tax=Dendrosporobacter sp. 1207_IL3150 TaxID=3084054 RepID=UPI002FD89472
MQVIFIGILASLFFASTFVLNRAMELAGGSWIWSASLRYLLTLPFLLLIVAMRKNMGLLIHELRSNLSEWLIWSTIGFGFFYAPICFAAAYGPAWLVAGSWQITIVAGSLLVPLIYRSSETTNGVQKIPLRELFISMFILFGVLLIQVRDDSNLVINDLIIGILPVTIAAFAYPLGNRKMMEICDGRLDVYQRVLGMTIASLPFWLILSAYGLTTVGLPKLDQVLSSFTVAIFSGIIATVLFFYATDKAQNNPQTLAMVEATQAGEIIFTIIGEMIFLAGIAPAGWSLVGIMIVFIGMIAHSFNFKRSNLTCPENSG